MAVKRCSECGAELSLGPARCPLSGSDPTGTRDWAPKKADEVDDYQADLRKLRAQLKKLREEDAEAV